MKLEPLPWDYTLRVLHHMAMWHPRLLLACFTADTLGKAIKRDPAIDPPEAYIRGGPNGGYIALKPNQSLGIAAAFKIIWC